jgi:anaerobic selenocysteine-containing dehydrogenase
VFAKLRSGTDIAFVGGMINYAIAHSRIQQEYVREYTNASWIVYPARRVRAHRRFSPGGALRALPWRGDAQFDGAQDPA